MRDAVRNVLQFQIATGEPIEAVPNIPPDWQRRLKADLVLEECKELIEGCGYTLHQSNPQYTTLSQGNEPSLEDVADACADLIYVVIGLANAWGVPLVAIWDAVHKANMAKQQVDGTFKRRSDGKILKPEGWQAVDIGKILAEYGKRYDDRTGTLSVYECDGCRLPLRNGVCYTTGCEYGVEKGKNTP